MTRHLPFGLLLLPLATYADSPPSYPDRANLLVVRDGDGKQQTVTDSAGWAKRRAHILRNMQEVMGPLPDDARKVPLDPKVEGESDEGAYTRFKLTIEVEKG